jgi:drug/metabolite transporter (DMT)-like permease
MTRIAGPFLIILGLAVALRRDTVDGVMRGLAESPAVMFFVGVLTVLIGIVVLVLHHGWRTPAEVAISFLGLLLTVRGGLLLAAPELVRTVMRRVEANAAIVWLGAALTILVGGWLAYEGYGRRPEDDRSSWSTT